MKTTLFILSIIFCFFLYSFTSKGSGYHKHYYSDTIPVVARSNASLYTQDARAFPKYNLNQPTYTDTLQADTLHVNGLLSIGNDYVGAIIYTSGDNNFWVRKKNGGTKYWSLVGSGGSSIILPTCGIQNGTAIVTYDSLLVFDITHAAYALCCDNQPRTTNDTTIVLPAADPDNPRIDAIVLTQNGIKIDTGVAAVNPAIPQLDSCQLLLTYVLINAGQTVPAFVNQNNPLIIYDEFATNEWDSLFRHNISVDSLSTAFPIHLTHAAFVNGYTVGDNYFEFYTDSTINLNDYGALKFYIRERDGFNLKVLFTWYLDGIPQTLGALAPINSGLVGIYQTMVMPTTAWRPIGTSLQVNKLRIQIQSGGAAGFDMDWLQLQTGIPPAVAVFGTVTTVAAGNLNPLFNVSIANPTTTPSITFTQQNAAAYTVFGNHTNASGLPTFGKVLLDHEVANQLPNSNLSPGPDGSFKGTVGGNVTDVVVPPDTILVASPLHLFPDGNGNDTLRIHLKAGTGITLDSNSDAITISADAGFPTLQQVFNTQVGGSIMTKNDTIQANGNTLKIIDTTSGAFAFQILHRGTGGAAMSIFNSASAGTAISISSSNGSTAMSIGVTSLTTAPAFAITSLSNSASSDAIQINFSGRAGGVVTGFAGGIDVFSSVAVPAIFRVDSSSATAIASSIELIRTRSAGATSNGVGTSIDFLVSTSLLRPSNQIISQWADATDATRTSQLLITGVNSGTSGTILTINAGGALVITVNTVSGTTNVLASTSAYQQVFTGGSGSTWTLPAVTGNAGLTYYIKNRGSASITLNSNAGGNDIYSTSAVNTLTITAGTSIVLVNDGSFYLVE